KTSGSSCVRIGCQTGFSNPSTISSTTAATLGIHSSTNPGRLCPSRDATGQQSVTQSEDWYKSLCCSHADASAYARGAPTTRTLRSVPPGDRRHLSCGSRGNSKVCGDVQAFVRSRDAAGTYSSQLRQLSSPASNR